MNPHTSAPFRFRPSYLSALTSLALVASAHAALFSEDFESYTPDAALNTSGPWSTISGATGTASLLVRDEATATPFGTPNQYLDYDDSDSGASVRVQSPNIPAASGAVTTLVIDFLDPSPGTGGNLTVGYANQSSDLNGTGSRLTVNLVDGTITGLTSVAAAGSDSYSLDTGYRLYMIFNDTASTVNYTGGSVAAGVADIWLQPIGGAAVYVGTKDATNSQTASYRVGLRSFSSVIQRALFDNVGLYQGVLVPGNLPNLVSTSPADDEPAALVGTDLVATFDKPVLPGSGSIALMLTAGDVPVESFDVSNPSEVTFAGSSVTVSPTSPLSINTGYYLLIPSAAIEDEIGEAFTGISLKTEWNFTTATDGTSPSLLTKSPADGSTGVALGTNLVATFDEVIAAGSGTITITNVTESNTFATIDITDGSQVSFTGSTFFTIDPTNDLREGRSYAVEISAGSVTDTTGNPFAGISGLTNWNFDTVPDTTNPTLVSTSPADDETNVSFTSNLEATFDEPIQAGTGNITIRNLTTSTIFATIPVGDAQVSISGDTLTINPTNDLDPGQYAVQIDAGAITDFSGNPYAGIVNPDVTSWNFTTYLLNSTDYIEGEREDLGALDYYTNSGSTQVGTGGPGGTRIDRNLVLGFTLPVLPVGETAGSVDFSFEITAAYDNTGGSGTNLPDLQVYLLDTANPDASGTTFFYHGPADPSTDVELVGTTSVSIASGSEVTFADDAEDRTLTLSGDALALLQSFYGGDNIPDQPEVFFRFNLDEDPAINTYRRYRIDLADDESDLQITSVLATPPALVGKFPADNTTSVYEGANLVATFDQPIQAGSGNITIKNLTDSNTFATIPVGDGQVSISGNKLTIDPSTDLDPFKEYAVQLDAGVIEDLTGQPYVGIVDPDVTSWSFTTGTSELGSFAADDRIEGRNESTPTGYYTGGAGGRVGIGGPTNEREDTNLVMSYTLPTLPVGTTVSSATFDFEITNYFNHSGADPALNVYLLDTTDPSSTGTAFFYHGPGDPNPDAKLVGATDISLPKGTQVNYGPGEQDHSYVITGDALALLQSFYGGDHIPDQTTVYFRFNLDNLVKPGESGEGADLTGATFDRYFINTSPLESGLAVTGVSVGGSGFASWASLNGASEVASDDHDDDGVSNGTEYFIGGPSGDTTGFTALPGVTTVGSVRSVTWTQGAGYTGIYGTSFVVQTSTSLAAGSWTNEILDDTVTVTGSDVTYTFPAGPVKNFVRLVVTP